MGRANDVEVRSPGITPKEHPLRKNPLTGRRKYPFKAMIVGDYFCIENQVDAKAARNSLKTFYKKLKEGGKKWKFTVRPKKCGVGFWICRRIV